MSGSLENLLINKLKEKSAGDWKKERPKRRVKEEKSFVVGMAYWETAYTTTLGDYEIILKEEEPIAPKGIDLEGMRYYGLAVNEDWMTVANYSGDKIEELYKAVDEKVKGYERIKRLQACIKLRKIIE